MRIKVLFRSAAAFLLAGTLLCSTAFASGSADAVSIALGEVGYTEGPEEYSKYGEWYGMPNSYWCDMFVSWCAMEAEISTDQFPRHCTCATHANRFDRMGGYEASAARGGSYVPQQGDLIFFYNPIRRSAQNHVGLVLYVEDGYVYTIEGNALTNRLDIPYEELHGQRKDALDPPDYVAVNCYRLDAPQIHGYGVPAYDDRTPLEMEGFVDLGRYGACAGMFETLCAEGVMAPTSAHTFSPLHGMARGEFVTLVMDFFGLQGVGPETPAFEDVPADSACYPAVMTARSAGILQIEEENTFRPEEYISPDEAQDILGRAMVYVGLEEQAFPFSEGDLSYIRPYTIRAGIAQAFFDLRGLLPLAGEQAVALHLDGLVLELSARELNGVYYLPVDALQQVFPGLDLVAEEEPSGQPAPLEHTDRVLPGTVRLWYEGAVLDTEGFTCQGTAYAALPDAAALLPLALDWTDGAPVIHVLDLG